MDRAPIFKLFGKLVSNIASGKNNDALKSEDAEEQEENPEDIINNEEIKKKLMHYSNLANLDYSEIWVEVFELVEQIELSEDEVRDF